MVWNMGFNAPTPYQTAASLYAPIFGLLWLLGYQLSPWLADAGEAVFWRVDKSANYGALDELARGCADLSKAEISGMK